MTEFRSPLSGDVTQAINPWTLWIRSLSAQTGFINIRNFNTGDAALEQEIVEDAASYGRQLGRINDVLEVLIARAGIDDPDEEERAALEDFRSMTDRIDALKRRRRSPARILGALDRVLREIRALKDEEPEVYAEAVARVRGVVGA